MPKKALVAFGVALGVGLVGISSFAWGAEARPMATAVVQNSGSTPGPINKTVGPESDASGALTLEAAVARALRSHPRLTVFSEEVQARQFELRQAGVWSNPELAIDMEDFAGSGEFSGLDQAETTILLSQQVELGGQRADRKARGQVDVALAESDYAAARAEVAAEATRRFVALVAAQQRQVLAADQHDLARQILAAVDERIAAGKSPAIERVRMESLVAETQLRQIQAQQQEAGAWRALRALWDDDAWVAAEVAVEADLAQMPPLPDWAAIEAGIDQSPAVLAQRLAGQRAGRDLELARASRIPDLTLSLGAKQMEETGDQALVAGVAFSLPLFDRQQGTIGAARSRQAKVAAQARAVRLALLTELGEIRQRLLSSHSEAEMLRQTLIPAVQRSFEAITYGYKAGKFGFLEVLEAEQSLFQARSRYIGSLATYHQAFADLEERLGQNIIPTEDGIQPSALPQRGQ